MMVVASLDLPDPSAWSPATWSALAAWATVLLVAVSAGFAFVQAQAAKHLREEQSKAFVVVDFDIGGPFLIDLTVSNLGKTVARDVRIMFDPPIERTIENEKGEDRLAESYLVRNGIPFLPPGKTIRTLFDVSHQRADSSLPTQYKVTVAYVDFRGRDVPPETYVLDLAVYWDLEQVRSKTTHDAVKALENIATEVRRWTKDLNGIRVYTADADRVDRQKWRWMRSQRVLAADETPRWKKRLITRANKFLDRFGL